MNSSFSASDKPVVLTFLPGKMRLPPAGSTRYHLWSLAKRGWRIIAVDPPHQLSNEVTIREFDDLSIIAMNTAKTPPFAVSKTVPGIATRHRNLTANQMWKSVVSELKKHHIKPDAVWLGSPWHAPLAQRAKETGLKTVHHVYDELSESDYLKPNQKRMLNQWEKELWKSTDLILCSSKPQHDKRDWHHQHVVLLENAVSDDFFSDSENLETRKPSKAEAYLIKAKHPRFVYSGVIDHRCNVSFFQAVADSDQCGSLTFLGYKGINIHPRLVNLINDHPKVHCTGTVEFEDYPELYRHADVCLLGHQNHPFTRVMYPEKILEYLSSGLPVISVPLPEVRRINEMSESGRAIYFAHDRKRLEKVTRLALNEDRENLRRDRINLAEANTWSTRADKLEELMMELISSSGSPR